MAMNFKDFYLGLADDKREVYAKGAGTTTRYIEIHLLPKRKIPRPKLLRGLADASHGKVTYESLLAYFHEEAA